MRADYSTQKSVNQCSSQKCMFIEDLKKKIFFISLPVKCLLEFLFQKYAAHGKFQDVQMQRRRNAYRGELKKLFINGH